MRKSPIQWLITAASSAILIISGSNQSAPENDEIPTDISGEIESELKRLVDIWYPRVIDEEYGGYLSRFSYNWRPKDPQDKMIVTQSRHLWTLSKLGECFSSDQPYREYAANGFDFLKNQMWDEQYGGFYQLVNREGEPISNSDEEIRKTLYGNAFALYGLSAYYHFSKDSTALELAKQTFNWLETHSHDPVHGGYFQPLDRDGTPDTTGTPKDYNSGIHILEALTELYTVWSDDLVRERLSEMFYIVSDIMVTEKGYLNLYFEPDWTHLSFRDSLNSVIRRNIGKDHITPGHDIETAYLLLESAHVLGIEKDQETHRIAKKLTDHTLEAGWDEDVGGFYDIGYYFPGDDELSILQKSKNWWAQAEGLNTLLIMADLYPDDPQNYFDKFVTKWKYIQENLIDSKHDGWYESGLDMKPDSKKNLKAHIWKGNYHTIRALLNCLERLKK